MREMFFGLNPTPETECLTAPSPRFTSSVNLNTCKKYIQEIVTLNLKRSVFRYNSHRIS